MSGRFAHGLWGSSGGQPRLGSHAIAEGKKIGYMRVHGGLGVSSDTLGLPVSLPSPFFRRFIADP